MYRYPGLDEYYTYGINCIKYLKMRSLKTYILITLAVTVLSACGGDSGSGNRNSFSANNLNTNNNNVINNEPDEADEWEEGIFFPASNFRNMCANPVTGSGDEQGTFVDENNFLRSHSNNTYLWYDEIVDRDPALHSTPDYFDLLKTDAVTPSGNFKDNFHFSLPTDELIAQSQSGISSGYGMEVALLSLTPPRQAVVAFTEPGTPATTGDANLSRGAEILTVDGVDVIFGSDADTLNAGLFPGNGETHSFTVRDLDGTIRSFTMTSAVITSTPVQNVTTFDTASGKVGYFLFNRHIATAEGGLINAINQLAAAGVDELVMDIRYNGGGFLDLASELSYMIAGAGRTSGQTFEEIKFNDKHQVFNPITGQLLEPVPFHSRSQGFDATVATGTVLPSLNLGRVYVLTGEDTCSASESIINSLRGVDVEVVQIGSTTCGKPYGFIPANNCGTTYFTIQFQGVNAKGFGDYPDGFSPINTVSDAGVLLPGCSVGDDFTAPLGEPTEARLAAAITHMDTGTCPIPSGFFGPQLLSLGSLPADNTLINKTVWQQNRIMRERL